MIMNRENIKEIYWYLMFWLEYSTLYKMDNIYKGKKREVIEYYGSEMKCYVDNIEQGILKSSCFNLFLKGLQVPNLHIRNIIEKDHEQVSSFSERY